ncbi:unnamed protein product [Wuchereria bancrofti]|uniref:Uncharacterized protein n=1 Tax=Wuchereria bancrofti TaxID=6293 RepID=A0A3P7EAJ0_WUCBA|nr:unnamed protein product [Wuchereria bancrofti]
MQDLPDIVDHYTVHKKTLTRITVSKIGLEDRRGKKGASAGLGCNVNTMKGTRNSRISSSSKYDHENFSLSTAAKCIRARRQKIIAKMSLKKHNKSAVPASRSGKNIINGGGDASVDKMMQSDTNVDRNMKQGFGAINTAKIFEKAKGRTID